LSYGSSGHGTVQSLTMESFCAMTGLNVLQVPFRGAGALVPAVLAGDVPLAVSSLHAILPHVQSGRLTLLATAGSQRFKGTPDTPTFGEFAKEYEPCASEFGLMAPAGLPPEVLNKLASALRLSVAEPDIATKLAGLGYEPAWLSPADYRAHMQANLRKYEKIVRIAGIKPE
jgi:tripartite-type tricarboxylate transporter receptor subunit TctC